MVKKQMDRKWQILFCDEIENACPVTQFINTIQPKHQVKVLRLLSVLEEQGPTMPRPYSDILHDGIHELRISLSQDNVRVLYFFCFRRFIVLYEAFLKNTQRVPEKYINNAISYREQFLARMSKTKLEQVSRAVF